MLNEIQEQVIADLAENFKSGEEQVITDIIADLMMVAFSTSNRKESNGDRLKPYIVEATKSEYLSRGSEGLSSLSEGGKSSNFINIKERMRSNIISDGMRLVF